VIAVLDRARSVGPLLSRIVAAALALPMDKTQAVIAGALGSFAIYAGAVVWVFAVRSARRAWAGLLIAAVPLLLAAWSVWSGGAGA
jgi:uncharacterized SAM-binding protein YcdF (DUF218 family)